MSVKLYVVYLLLADVEEEMGKVKWRGISLGEDIRVIICRRYDPIGEGGRKYEEHDKKTGRILG